MSEEPRRFVVNARHLTWRATAVHGALVGLVFAVMFLALAGPLAILIRVGTAADWIGEFLATKADNYLGSARLLWTRRFGGRPVDIVYEPPRRTFLGIGRGDWIAILIAIACTLGVLVGTARAEPPGLRVTWTAAPSQEEFARVAVADLVIGQPFVVALSPERAMFVADEITRLREENAALRAEADAARAVVDSMTAELKIAHDLRALDSGLTLKLDEFTRAEKRLAKARGSRLSWGLGGFAAGILVDRAISR